MSIFIACFQRASEVHSRLSYSTTIEKSREWLARTLKGWHETKIQSRFYFRNASFSTQGLVASPPILYLCSWSDCYSRFSVCVFRKWVQRQCLPIFIYSLNKPDEWDCFFPRQDFRIAYKKIVQQNSQHLVHCVWLRSLVVQSLGYRNLLQNKTHFSLA